MPTKDEHIRDNKQKVENFPEEIPNVEVDINGTIVESTIKKMMFSNGAALRIENKEFPNGIMSVSIPFMGKAGYVPTEEEMIQLCRGEMIRGEGLFSNAGKEYGTNFVFDPLHERHYKGKTYYGNVDPVFDKFKSKDKDEDDE